MSIISEAIAGFLLEADQKALALALRQEAEDSERYRIALRKILDEVGRPEATFAEVEGIAGSALYPDETSA
jgi:hypothetical protein